MGSASRFDITTAQMTDGPGRLARPPPIRPVDRSPSLCPCHAFFLVPFNTVNICANLASSSRGSLQSSILMPNILSQSTILSPAKNAFPSLPDFSVLFLHTIFLIHRHLALYHSQVAISEFEIFESSPTSKIRPGICPTFLSPLQPYVCVCRMGDRSSRSEVTNPGASSIPVR
jgi:hypothetical protein